jgi:PAS domain-containing protein
MEVAGIAGFCRPGDVGEDRRWHLTRAHAMRDREGKIGMWIGSNTDIHEQKRTEEELRRAN